MKNVTIPSQFLQELLALCGPEDHELRERVLKSAAPAHPAEGVPAQDAELDIDGLIDRLLDAQQDLNLAANVHMDQSIASASTLLDEVEIALRTLAATQPAAQGVDAQDAARWRMITLIEREVMMHPDKRSSPEAVGAYMKAVREGLNFEAAIDASLAAQAKQGGAA